MRVIAEEPCEPNVVITLSQSEALALQAILGSLNPYRADGIVPVVSSTLHSALARLSGKGIDDDYYIVLRTQAIKMNGY